ncbi:efflux RND transporter periplasmic adaptor subunit [Acinetobacter celticus]|uniref:Efflux transporter periplasmic adaptor subunit n=1 Tax=Acinetobacter celticus TaxID=1891224 RepID=A0A1C3CZ31_9GAMM|nr:efflux RND transporter periplasmic adaptor subunit [Acinetobacter celticus]ODA13799.1 efflux transporter periplasmic adaptor subunit [Acinetobacter celticus]
MQSAQSTTYLYRKNFLFYFKISILCFSTLLVACQKNEPEQPSKNIKKIELIQQDLVPIQLGTSVNQTNFTGTIRAVNQSSIQAQVTATATQVNAKVGQSVTQGQILVRLNNQDNAARLAQSQANLAATKAQANQAKLMMQRKQRLLNQGFISKVEFEQSQVDYQAQLENVNAQQSNVDIARKADQDGIITSPINGVITKRQVEPGQTVAVGTTLFEIIDPNHLEIQAQLPSDMQAALKIGQKIEYTLQGNPNKLTATLSRISPLADPTSRQIDFFAKLNESITSLSIGSFLEGSILGTQAISGQIIPLDTVHDLPNKPYVWLIRENKIIRQNVTVLEQRYNTNIAVVQGLKNTDLISRVKFNDDDIQKAVSINKE